MPVRFLTLLQRFEYKFFVGAPSTKKCKKFSNCHPVSEEDQKELWKRLREEQSTYGDLVVLENVPEYYGNLTKKMMNTFQWVVDHEMESHKQYSYFIGVDDDVYLRLDLFEPNLFKQTRERLYMGKVQKYLNVGITLTWL